MPRFVPDPSSELLGTISLPAAAFHALPDHPVQRQTVLHAARLMASSVMAKPLDQHREVSVVLIGDPATGRTIEAMAAMFVDDPPAAIRRFGAKLNGHTRSYLWFRDDAPLPVPETLHVTVHAAADEAAAIVVYNAVDSVTSSKTKRDDMQSALAAVRLYPTSQFMRSATGLTGGLDLASGVLFGTPKYRARHLLPIADGQLAIASSISREAIEELSYMPAAGVFLDALKALDGLDLSPRTMPARPAHLGAYLSILARDPDTGLEFVKLVRDHPGNSNAGAMDVAYLVRNAWDRVPHARGKVTPAARARHVLNVILGGYEHWLADPDWRTTEFSRSNVADRFNPVLKKLGEEYGAQRGEQKVSRRVRSSHGTSRSAEQPLSPPA